MDIVIKLKDIKSDLRFKISDSRKNNKSVISTLLKVGEKSSLVRLIKKFFYFSLFTFHFSLFTFHSYANSSRLDFKNTYGLPSFYKDSGILKKEVPYNFLLAIIKEAIKYVGIIAIITTMIGGIMFLVSVGNDEKVKKAKNVIIYSIIGVLVSIASFTMVDIINNLNLG